MKIKNIGSNQTELTIGQTKVLFSYETPVAAMNLSPEFFEAHGSSLIRTATKYSRTTSKHINCWCGGADAGKEVPQSVIDLIANN